MRRPIGVFDSGVGGLSVLQSLRSELPHESFVYLADSGHAPYGERDDAYVVARARAAAAHLVRQGIKALVIACNTATAAAIDLLRAEHPALAIIGVEPALKPAALLSGTRRIGVMATRSTLASTRFRTLLDSLEGQAVFVLQPCDGLAAVIERAVQAESGDDADADAAIAAACAHHTLAMGRFGVVDGEIDTLVLGCTHYPFASEHLRALLGPGIRFLDTGEPVARQTRLRLLLAGVSAPASHMSDQVSFLTTGHPLALQAAAKRWLQLDVDVGLLPF